MDHIYDPWSFDPLILDQKNFVISWFWSCRFLWSHDLDLTVFCDPVQKKPWSCDPKMSKTYDPVISIWRQRMIPWSQNEDNAWSRDLKMPKKNDLVIWELIIFVILWSHNEANSWSRDLRIHNFCDLMIS